MSHAITAGRAAAAGPEMQKAPRTVFWGLSTDEVRRCPTLPRGHPCSTIGAESLSFRVRNVTGRFPLAMAAETLLMFRVVHTNGVPVHREPQSGREQQSCDSYALSTEGVCCQVIGLLVPVSCTGL